MPVVLSDLRYEVDLLPFSDESPLHLLNVDRSGTFADEASEPLCFTRYGRPVIMETVRNLPDLLHRLDAMPRASRNLIVDIGLDDLEEICQRPGHDRDWLVGIQPGSVWILGGTATGELPSRWSLPQAVPLASGRP